VLFRRRGWAPADYQAWSDRMLAEQIAFVVPTTYGGETVLRFCFVNPHTTLAEVEVLLSTLA
jgi:L-2,4-diaminobutyrate decarboxylase